MSRLEVRTFWGILVATLVYVAFAMWADLEKLLDISTSIDPKIFIMALALSLANYFVRFLKWTFLLGVLDIRIPLKPNVLTFLAGFVMAATPGKLGEVLKSGLLYRTHRIAVERTAPVVLAERLTDLLGLAIIALVGSLAFGQGGLAIASVFALLIALVFLLQSKKVADVVLSGVGRFAFGEKFVPRLRSAYEATRDVLSFRPLVVTTAMSVLSWSMEAVAFWMIVDALGGEMSMLLGSFVFSMTTILGALSFLPGGVGVTEGSMIGLLLFFGVFDHKAFAASATYLIRFATLWFAVGIGAVAYAIHNRVIPRADATIVLDQ